ncbi:MAG: isoprenylcysteine carboxylmethyltransferase family protein, partial [Planctomycetes bacterium]|nr:isoprenylcysteine carboxylmethyltransferase family protein [Planctomycetota bacterium]
MANDELNASEQVVVEKPSEQEGYGKIVVKSVLKMAVFLALMFLVAGRWDYWQGWIFCGVMAVHLGVAFSLFADMPDLARERMKPGPGMKGYDKVFWGFFIVFSIATIFSGPLDVGRLGWTKAPVYLYVIGYLVYAVSVALNFWAMRVNRFFSSVVRIQKDRGQVVIDSGPYAWVRHPGYVTGMLMFLSLPVALGSLAGLAP